MSKYADNFEALVDAAIESEYRVVEQPKRSYSQKMRDLNAYLSQTTEVKKESSNGEKN